MRRREEKLKKCIEEMEEMEVRNRAIAEKEYWRKKSEKLKIAAKDTRAGEDYSDATRQGWSGREPW